MVCQFPGDLASLELGRFVPFGANRYSVSGKHASKYVSVCTSQALFGVSKLEFGVYLDIVSLHLYSSLKKGESLWLGILSLKLPLVQGQWL